MKMWILTSILTVFGRTEARTEEMVGAPPGEGGGGHGGPSPGQGEPTILKKRKALIGILIEKAPWESWSVMN